MTDSEGSGRGASGLVRAASEELLERFQALADAVRRAGAGAAEFAGPVPAAATDVMQSMRAVLESVQAPTAPLDMLMEEIKAKRAMVRAMQEQLASFDTQLEVLERSLVPMHEWSRQWENLQGWVFDPLSHKRD